ncbi:MAG TPA: NosD domain-containing protein [Candidatus Bathyarchaeia archaeon]|nr:NosD domain-containing protein [Candidatus Bathyarchaeia archaeon]
MRRIASSLIVALLVLSLSILAFNVKPARAQSGGAIIINPDGSISSPVTANITTSDEITYTFTGNNYLPIVVERSNIIINGNGNTLQASGGFGFSLTDMSSVTIKNTTITKSYYGIFLNSSSSNTLSDNNATANGIGFYLFASSNDNTLSGNNVRANSVYGIYLDNSSSNVLSDNNITANRLFGIDLYSSSDNTLSGNVMANNTYNLAVYGFVLSDFVNSIDVSNLVNGKPVYYLIGQSNVLISPQTCPKGAGYLGLVNCKNMTVQGLTLDKNFPGLLIANTNDSRIADNNVTASSNYGMLLCYSSGDVASGNDIIANDAYGIFASCLNNSTLSGNNATADYGGGIALDSSSGDVVSGNSFTANNGGGVVLFSSSGNSIFHNDFWNNVPQAQASSNSSNAWDDGYPSGGNYWSNYQTRYPSAIANDSSAIWNTPYDVASNNIDRYPLMAPFDSFNVTWNNQTYPIETVSNSTLSNFNFSATAKTLTFNVTGTSGTVGFCRVAIPLSLMSGEWTVTVNGTPISYSTLYDSNYTYVYFKYMQSTKTVQIQSTNAVPEFQPFMLLPLFMIVTLLGAIAFKKRAKKLNAYESRRP